MSSYETLRLKPSLVPYLSKPVGLLTLSLALFAFSQPDILAAASSLFMPFATANPPQTFESFFRILSLASLLTGAAACVSFPFAIAYRNANTYILTHSGIIIRRPFVSRIRREIPYRKHGKKAHDL